MSENRRQSRPTPADRSRGDANAAGRGEREQRLAAALRENLRRRKEQARAQGAAVPEEDTNEKPKRSA